MDDVTPCPGFDRAALHREVEALTMSLVKETRRISEMGHRDDLARGTLWWLPVLCVGVACLNLLGGMTALLIALR